MSEIASTLKLTNRALGDPQDDGFFERGFRDAAGTSAWEATLS